MKGSWVVEEAVQDFGGLDTGGGDIDIADSFGLAAETAKRDKGGVGGFSFEIGNNFVGKVLSNFERHTVFTTQEGESVVQN